MTNHHPITLPPELIQQWWAEETYDPFGVAISRLATQAARWGADQELEAILEMGGQQELPEEDRYFDGFTVASIRAARRPKSPSLKQKALDDFDGLMSELDGARSSPRRYCSQT